ncbi:hypothetical protein M2335_002258 [Sphingobium sp. B12D2B]|nr:hypothetical protein [Sphingobium sp. B12D2B]
MIEIQAQSRAYLQHGARGQWPCNTVANASFPDIACPGLLRTRALSFL